jgi:hypothetical protein
MLVDYVYVRAIVKLTSRLLPLFASLLEGPDFGDYNRLASALVAITLNKKLRMYEGYDEAASLDL